MACSGIAQSLAFRKFKLRGSATRRLFIVLIWVTMIATTKYEEGELTNILIHAFIEQPSLLAV